MPRATVTSKGQITIPVEVRRALGLRSGSRLDFVRHGNVYELVVVTGSVRALKGVVPADRPVSLEEMDAAIADAAVGGLGR